MRAVTSDPRPLDLESRQAAEVAGRFANSPSFVRRLEQRFRPSDCVAPGPYSGGPARDLASREDARKEKSTHAVEQDRPGVARHRWPQRLAAVAPGDLVFPDEARNTATPGTHGNAPKGERGGVAASTFQGWRAVTFVGDSVPAGLPPGPESDRVRLLEAGTGVTRPGGPDGGRRPRGAAHHHPYPPSECLDDFRNGEYSPATVAQAPF